MTKEEYHQLLKDGRWQRRRLEIMQRDDFKCRDCGTTDDLNVHHIRYLAGRKPWEYDDGDLITLCGKCHKKWHEGIEGMHYDCPVPPDLQSGGNGIANADILHDGIPNPVEQFAAFSKATAE